MSFSKASQTKTTKKKMTEKQLQSQIIEALNYSGKCWVWNNNAGMIPTFDKKGKQRRIFVGRAGEPDIMGVRRSDGKFIGIEVKLPKRRSRVTDNQREFLDKLGMHKALTGVATSAEEALEIIEDEK